MLHRAARANPLMNKARKREKERKGNTTQIEQRVGNTWARQRWSCLGAIWKFYKYTESLWCDLSLNKITCTFAGNKKQKKKHTEIYSACIIWTWVVVLFFFALACKRDREKSGEYQFKCYNILFACFIVFATDHVYQLNIFRFVYISGKYGDFATRKKELKVQLQLEHE